MGNLPPSTSPPPPIRLPPATYIARVPNGNPNAILFDADACIYHTPKNSDGTNVAVVWDTNTYPLAYCGEYLYNRDSGKIGGSGTNVCLDIPASDTSKPLVHWTCHGGLNQAFDYDSAILQFRSRLDPTKCLAFGSADWAQLPYPTDRKAKYLYVRPCNPSDVNQRLEYLTNH